MIKKIFELGLESGMHARPAGLLVKSIGPLDCSVDLVVGEKIVNGKSIMAIMSAGFRSGVAMEIICDGPDEEKAMALVTDLFDVNFNE